MAVVVESTHTGSDTGASSVATSTAVPVGTDQLYLAIITTRLNAQQVDSVSGLGLTWTLVDRQVAGRAQVAIELWSAAGSPTEEGVVTATLTDACDAEIIEVFRIDGHNVASPFGAQASANTNGLDGADSGGTDNNDVTWSMTTEHNNSLVVVGFDARNSAVDLTTGWTQHDAVSVGSGGTNIRLYPESRTIATAGAITIGAADNIGSDRDWVGLSVEIRVAGGAGGGAQPPRTLHKTRMRRN